MPSSGCLTPLVPVHDSVEGLVSREMYLDALETLDEALGWLDDGTCGDCAAHALSDAYLLLRYVTTHPAHSVHETADLAARFYVWGEKIAAQDAYLMGDSL